MGGVRDMRVDWVINYLKYNRDKWGCLSLNEIFQELKNNSYYEGGQVTEFKGHDNVFTVWQWGFTQNHTIVFPVYFHEIIYFIDNFIETNKHDICNDTNMINNSL